MSSIKKGAEAHMDKALLEKPRTRRAPQGREGRGRSLIALIGFTFLTFSSGMAVYRSNGDLVSCSFVACARLYERTPPESHRKRHLKMAVWLLPTMLTAVFSYKVAATMPFRVHAAPCVDHGRCDSPRCPVQTRRSRRHALRELSRGSAKLPTIMK
jgi:hypothetical protein